MRRGLSSIRDITRIDLGYFTMPGQPGNPMSGQAIVVCAYLIRHPRGLFLFDTGLAKADPETEARYHPVPWPLNVQLKRLGLKTDDVAAVANCHLHFDHAGGNRHFPRRPIFSQRREFDSAQRPNYTMPIVVDFRDASYELLDGDAEVWPGLRVIPIPGHTDGHQALIVDTPEGHVALAGQSFNTTSEFAAAQFAWQLGRNGSPHPGEYPDWMTSLEAYEPARVLFARDVAVWERGAGPKPRRRRSSN